MSLVKHPLGMMWLNNLKTIMVFPSFDVIDGRNFLQPILPSPILSTLLGMEIIRNTRRIQGNYGSDEWQSPAASAAPKDIAAAPRKKWSKV